ncbi:MAG TPA: helix-turn-helix domain-containing protein [Rhodocyclaceae bacterium]|nr:helix-turn-helix domain-containing protein [Rhodocyclaceae bacterium]
MSEVKQLIATVKRQLRLQGLNYRDVAAALKLSEASVKRLFSAGSFSLERLAEVAALLGYTVAELAQEAAAGAPLLHTLSELQEEELASDTKLLLVAACALNHWGYADILRTYRLTEAECLERLLRLDRLRLIDLLPGNRIRLRVARNFDWLPHGPIRRYFHERGQSDFLNSRFTQDGEALAFVHGMLGDDAVALMQNEIRRLRKRFSDLHEEATALPFEQRHGTGVLLAMREWEPEEFARLRR